MAFVVIALAAVALVGRQADRATIVRFSLPAIAAAVCGAWLAAESFVC